MLKYLPLLSVVVLLASCPVTKDVNENSNPNVSGSTDTDTIIVEQDGGMSDPSKCNNLPPQEMADCLEKSMGG